MEVESGQCLGVSQLLVHLCLLFWKICLFWSFMFSEKMQISLLFSKLYSWCRRENCRLLNF